METKKSLILGILLFILVFTLIQTVTLLGKTSQGYNLNYIITYTVFGILAIVLIGVFGFATDAARDNGNEDLIDVVTVNDFSEEQDFRLPMSGILMAAAIFIIFVSLSAATGLVSWQPIPSPFTLNDGVKSPLASGHNEALATMGITKTEEQWFTSAQPAFFEEPIFNFFLPMVLTALLLALPLAFGLDLNKTSFTIACIIACLISSGITGYYNSGLIPTFAGAHSNVYTNTPAFYTAAAYSFAASFINVQLGFPITIPAHFLNNWFVVAGMAVAFSVGIAAKSSLLYSLFSRRSSPCKVKYY